MSYVRHTISSSPDPCPRGDPSSGLIQQLERWRVAALKRAPVLGVDLASVNEAAGVVEAVFGDAWLTAACQPTRAHPLPFRSHPIGNLIDPPGANQVVGLLELVEYLKFAAGSHVFGAIVDGLKSEYGHTFLQLAFGLRLARAGAEGVSFEPPVQRGLKGDIACYVGGQRVIGECYIPRLPQRGLEADWLLQRCIELRDGERPCVLTIAIKLRKAINSVERKTTVRLVREACQEIETSVAAGNVHDDARYVETDAAHVSVARTVAVGPGELSLGRVHPRFPDQLGREPSTFARIGVVQRADLRNDQVLVEGHETRDSVAIWLADKEQEAESMSKNLDEPMATLGRKFERKLAQTKLDTDTGRLLIVSSWITGQIHRVATPVISNLKDVLFRKHDGVVGLLMVMRSYRKESARHYYRIEPVLPEGGGALPPETVGRLFLAERDQPIPPSTTPVKRSHG